MSNDAPKKAARKERPASATRVSRAARPAAVSLRERMSLTESAIASLRRAEKRLTHKLARLEQQIENQAAALEQAEALATESELMALNERQSYEGLARLRADLIAMREAGLIDEKGEFIRERLSLDGVTGSYDA